MTRLAVTGGTGFVGSHLLDRALSAGHEIRALTRRDQPAREGIAWIKGDLGNDAALAELCKDTEAIIHIAGAISAPDRDGFAKSNIEGTARTLAAADAAGARRFVHVSTLAAREPGISDYGWSKAQSEKLVRASGLDWTIVRPPAVYGPGDRETLELFKMAARGRVVLPPAGKLSLIHVADLTALLLACSQTSLAVDQLYEPDDGHPGGRTHRAFAAALGVAVGRKIRTVSMPAPLVKLGARLDRLFRGSNAKLTPDRARYFCHSDWVANREKHPNSAIWEPAIRLQTGLAQTAAWYREQGWLA